MLATILLFCAIAFDESPVLHQQIQLDRHGFSCNTIDGQWGTKTENALRAFLRSRNHPWADRPWGALKEKIGDTAGAEFNALFPSGENLFRIETVTQADIDALVAIPAAPADKAKLQRMGYESIKEMFAERGHMSPRALERLNPGVDWNNVRPGLKLIIPDFPSMEEELRAGDRNRRNAPKRPQAALVKVSLSRFEITVYNAKGKQIALFPCSIARDKSKLPPQGELKITSYIANPNYTYKPDFVPAGKKAAKYIFPEGPNCPVGVAWMGLSLPGYGIHGTPHPESIGNAESHGCFRLSNWNAARLYAMVQPGTKVIVEQ